MPRESTQMTFVLFRNIIVMPTAYASISAYYAISKTRYILIEYDIDIILKDSLNINTLFNRKQISS
jgi:hypothetical protein